MFGQRIKEQRIKLNMTQKRLAEEMHIAQASIAGYESENSFPDFEKLTWLCKFFDVTSDYLLGISDVQNDKTDIYSIDEKNVLKYYQRLDQEDKDYIKGLMIQLSRNKDEIKKKKSNEKIS